MPKKPEDLGPLWGPHKKEDGFRMAIPDPEDLALWAWDAATSDGDRSQEDVGTENRDQLILFMFGLSQSEMPGRVWEMEINDSLFASVRVELRAGYTPVSGEYGAITIRLQPSAELEKNNGLWDFAKNAETMVALMQAKGFKAQLLVDEEGDHSVVINNHDDSSEVEINLGYTSQQDAALADEDYDPETAEPIFIPLGRKPHAF